jgi:hypothetical protein
MRVLSEQKRALLEKWLERTLATYPSQTLRFLQGEKDRFRNPVGHTLREGLATLLDELTGEMDPARIGPALESIVRLRAVQDFTPSQAVGFVYLLREILQEESAGGEPLGMMAGAGLMVKLKIWETAAVAASVRRPLPPWSALASSKLR